MIHNYVKEIILYNKLIILNLKPKKIQIGTILYNIQRYNFLLNLIFIKFYIYQLNTYGVR